MAPLFLSSAQSVSISVGDWISRTWCLVVLVAAALLASPLSSVAQETRTQQVQLEQGWNLVSLNVQPDDSSFAALFGANVDQIAMIKNEEGEVYAPGEGIEQITTWKSGEGYQIHAKASLTLGVTGTSIRPDSMSIVLEEGGNVVPYLSTTAQGVAPALTSVEESLVAVEDDGGGQYAPSASSSLDSLRPGQAYKVYVDQSDTLRYPIVVSTLAEAKALVGVEVGKTIRVQGYHAPGDGGGGTFEVTDSGAETDGGTVFVFNEHKSQEVTETIREPTWNQVAFANSDLVWGSFSARYGADPEDVIGIKHLHGHNTKSQGSSSTYVDLKDGVFGNTGAAFKNLTDLGYGDDTWEYSYKYATSERRLERVGVSNSVNLAWWGAPKADPNTPETADPLLKWAINAAARRYKNSAYDWVYVDIPDEYYWLHTTHLRNGVKLRGVGDVISQEWNTKGALTFMPEMAIYYNKVGYDPQAPENRDLYHGALEQRKRHTFTNEYNAQKVGFQNLRVSGNLSNQSVFENLGDYEDPENILQNSGTWSGFYSTGKTGESFPDGMVVDLDNVNITRMGGSAGFGLSSGNADFQTNNVNVKDAVRNHIIYSATGTMDDVTIQGQAWGAFFVIGDARTSGVASYKNLTMKNLKEGYYFYDAIIQDRSGPATLDGFSIGLSDLIKSKKITVDIFAISNYGGEYKNGTIDGYMPEKYELSNVPTLIKFRSFSKTEVEQETLFENITYTDNGQPVNLYGGPALRRVKLKNVTVELGGGVSGNADVDPIVYSLQDPDPDWNRAYRIFNENVKYLRGYTKRGAFNWSDKGVNGSKAHPLDVFWKGGEINNIGGKFAQENGYKAERIFSNNLKMNVRGFKGFHSDLRPNDVGRLRNCQDNLGRTSDAVNQGYTATADDESDGYALIPTSLMSRAWETDVTANAGYSVTGVEIANSDGTLRADDNSDQQDPYLKVSVDGSITQGDTFTWTARVTPLEDYQTTGLFVARELSNQTFTSGNGPWTLDLRGTAASQESREKIVYTASSGDTSVATANVQSDEYTLELTEQGTGTTTITVTGEIPGVGATTDTFQVTVE